MDFVCNVTMLLGPRTGWTAHRVDLTADFTPSLNMSSTFNTTDQSLTAKAVNPGTFNLIAYEKNYNMSVNTTISVLPCNWPLFI